MKKDGHCVHEEGGGGGVCRPRISTELDFGAVATYPIHRRDSKVEAGRPVVSV